MDGLLVKTLAIYALAAVVTFVVAIVIKGIVRLLQAIEGSSASATPPETMRPELADLPPAIPPEHIAAIGAAVHAMMGTYRIIHIEDQHRRSAWIESGRLAHHRSHASQQHHKH